MSERTRENARSQSYLGWGLELSYLIIHVKGDPHSLENLERFELHTYRCGISIYIKKFWKDISHTIFHGKGDNWKPSVFYFLYFYVV